MTIKAVLCRMCDHPEADHVDGHGCTTRLEDKSECECGGFTLPVGRKYAFSLHAESDASPAVKRLITSLNWIRCEEDFRSEELQVFRDGLSAVGILVVEIETWTETPHEVVL